MKESSGTLKSNLTISYNVYRRRTKEMDPSSTTAAGSASTPVAPSNDNTKDVSTVKSTNGDNQVMSESESKRLINIASTSLIRFTPSLLSSPMIITSAQGVYITTSSGRRVLDFTSGQMSCLLGHSHPDIVRVITKYAGKLDHLFTLMLSESVLGLAEKLTGVLRNRVGVIGKELNPNKNPSMVPEPTAHETDSVGKTRGGAVSSENNTMSIAGGESASDSVLPSGVLDRCVFLSTGGEANEFAVKMAKMYTGKFEIVGLSSSWHGMTHAASAATYAGAGRRGFGPHVPGNLVLPSPNAYRSIFRNPDGSHDWYTEMMYGWSLVDAGSVGSLAAVMIEPVLSAGGMHPLPAGYLREMKKQCEKRGMLLIVDEAQTGLGRTGKWFAFEHDGVVPDILTLSKTLGNGIPLSAVITHSEIEKSAHDHGFYFYTTHCNDPLPAAVGLEVLNVVGRDNLVQHAKEMGDYLLSRLKDLQKRYGCIGDVRGLGLMVGIEIVKDRETKEANHKVGAELGTRMMEMGLSANIAPVPGMGDVFRIAPPIVVTKNEIDEALAIMEKAFQETEGTMPLN